MAGTCKGSGWEERMEDGGEANSDGNLCLIRCKIWKGCMGALEAGGLRCLGCWRCHHLLYKGQGLRIFQII